MTAPTAPFAIAPDGAFLACVDGPELLVYRSTGAPAWKEFCDDILVGVAATLDQVVAIEGGGTLRRWRRDDGMPLDPVHVPGAPRDLVSAADGTLAVVTEAGPLVVRVGLAPQHIGVPDTSACGFGPDGGALGVGSSTGAFTAVDARTGGAWGMIQVSDEPIAGVAWSSRGHWILTSGQTLWIVQGDGQAVVGSIPVPDGPLGAVACAVDGIVAAAVAGTHQVVAFDLHAQRSAGALTFRREVGRVTFGAGTLLGIGLDDGDATMLDLISGGPSRTEPHQGRARNVWNMDDRVDHGMLRGAVAFHRAGADPIAKYIPRPEAEEGRGGWLGTCLGCLGMMALIAGCGVVVMGLMYVIYAFGLWEMIPIR